jgi:hypothetical protein
MLSNAILMLEGLKQLKAVLYLNGDSHIDVWLHQKGSLSLIQGGQNRKLMRRPKIRPSGTSHSTGTPLPASFVGSQP